MILLDRFATTGSFEHIENIFFWIKQVRYQYYHFGYHLNWLAIEHTGYRKTELLKNYNYVVIDSFQPYYTRHILDHLRPGAGGGDPFPELLKGVTCSIKGLQLGSRKNLQFKTHFWCISHLVPEI